MFPPEYDPRDFLFRLGMDSVLECVACNYKELDYTTTGTNAVVAGITTAIDDFLAVLTSTLHPFPDDDEARLRCFLWGMHECFDVYAAECPALRPLAERFTSFLVEGAGK